MSTKKTIGVYGAEDTEISENIVIGHNAGVHIEGGRGTKVMRNAFLSGSTIHILREITALVERSNAPEHVKAQYVSKIQAGEAESLPELAIRHYREAISFLADHAQLFGPALPPLLAAVQSALGS